MPYHVASDLGLHSLPHDMPLLQVSQLKWDKEALFRAQKFRKSPLINSIKVSGVNLQKKHIYYFASLHSRAQLLKERICSSGSALFAS